MMSVFFHFKHTLYRLFNNCIKLYWSATSPQKKLSSKSPALLELITFLCFKINQRLRKCLEYEAIAMKSSTIWVNHFQGKVSSDRQAPNVLRTIMRHPCLCYFLLLTIVSLILFDIIQEYWFPLEWWILISLK